MSRTAFLVRGVGIAALMAIATPALAGDDERAGRAIAEAQGKLDAATNLGTTGEAPELHARAASALRSARENLKRGHEREAFDQANEASTLADLALNRAQQARQNADQAARADAEGAVVAAQQQAADANARAAEAQRAAAAAAADAAAARAAPPVVVAAPTTTVTTETVRPAATTTRARTTHRVTRPRARATTTTTTRPAAVERTTTTVTQSN